MNLLRLITLPYARKHTLRCLLTLVGIMLGVGLFVAMSVANQSVLDGFRQTVERIAGRAQLQVSAGDAGFEEEVLDRVRSVPEVARAAPVIEAVAGTSVQGEGNLLVLGIDMVGDAGLRDYSVEGGGQEVVDDPLVFLAQPDSIILTHDFAERNSLRINSKLLMQTMEGKKEFTVRGLLRPTGMASAYGGNLAVMDIYATQKVFGGGRRFDRIDVIVADGSTVEGAQQALHRALGPSLAVELPEQRGHNFEALLAGYSAVINTTSVFALLIGMFVVYNSFAVAVTQRRSEIGILRALGATRRQIRNLFLMESGVAGILGAAGGTWIGWEAAKLLANITARVATAISGMEQRPGEVPVSAGLLASAGVMGALTTMAAAWIPARNAAAIEPVLALQRGKQLAIPAAENRSRVLVALAALAVSAGCFFWAPGPLFYAGFVLLVAAAVLLVPALSSAAALAIRVPLRLLSPVEGMLAADSLIKAPRRTSATVTALMLSLAIVVAMGGAGRAVVASIEQWVNSAFRADLVVLPSESLTARSFHFPSSIQGELQSMPEVEEVQPVRSVRIPVNGSPVMIIGLDIAMEARRSPLRVVAGDSVEMHRRAASGQGFIISENLALLQKIKLGALLELAAPAGTLRLPVVGVFRDLTNQTGSIYMDLTLFRHYWEDDSLDLLHVFLRPGVAPAEAKRRILARLESQRRVFVFLNADLRAFVMNVGNQWFGLTYVQIGVAIFIAVLGIVNSLTVSIIDRRRELGILRAAGAFRKQVRRTLCFEAMAIALLGVVLGLALGGIGLFYQIETLRRSIVAMPLDYMFPTAIALALFPTMLGIAYLSSLAPAASAVRGNLVEALEYE